MTARTQSTRSRHWPRRLWVPWLASVALASGLTAGAAAIPAARPAIAPVPDCRAASLQPAAAPRGFLGYACRDERCTSHKAGFDWAERNGVREARACQARNDVAFTEGCRAYAVEAVTAEQAGFQWARENDMADPCLCAGGGAAFEAGCEAYIRGFAD